MAGQKTDTVETFVPKGSIPVEEEETFIPKGSILVEPEVDPLQDAYNMADTLPDSETEKDKINKSIAISKGIDRKPSEIYADFDTYVEQIEKAEIPQYAYGPLGALWNSMKQALAQKPAMMAGGLTAYTPGKMLFVDPALQKTQEYLESKRDPGKQSDVEEILAGKLWPTRIGNKWYQVEPNLVIPTMTAWAAQVGDQFPLMLITATAEIGSRLIAGMVAGTTAIATAGPDPSDVVVVPMVYKATQKVTKELIQFGLSAPPLVLMETGGFLDYASALGIDTDIAEKYSRLYGPASGVVEYVEQIGKIRPFMNLGKKSSQTLARKMLKELGMTGVEGLEELTQNTLEKYFIGQAIEEMKARNPEYDETKPGLLEGGLRSFVIGAGVSAITRGLGNVTSTVYNKYSPAVKDMLKKSGIEVKEPTPAEKAQAESAKQMMGLQKGMTLEEATKAVKEKVSPKEPVSTVVEKGEKQPWEMTIEEYRDKGDEELKGLADYGKYEGEIAPVGSFALDASEDTIHQLMMIPTESIIIRPENARRDVDIKTFRDYIQEGSPLPPLWADKTTKGIILEDGHQRLAAAKQLGLKQVPVWVNEGETRKNLIQVAIQEGKPVPPEVLKDYPDLAKLAPEAIKPKKGKPKLDERQALADKIEDVKLRNEIQMGKATIGEFIKEEKAVEVSGKKIGEAGRKGFVEGKKVGVEKQKVHDEAKETRARDRKRVREYIKKIAKTIGKETPTNVHYDYAVQIQAIQDTLDIEAGLLKKRLPQTIEMRQKLKEAIDSYPALKKQIPEKIYQALNRKTIDDFTIEELEGLSKHLEYLRKQGKTEKDLNDNEREYKWVNKRDDMIGDINGGFPTLPLTAEDIAKRPSGLKQLWLNTLLPQNILDKLGGGKAKYENTVYRNYYREINTLENQKQENVDRRGKIFSDGMDTIGIKKSDLLMKHETFGGVKYTVADMLFIYNGVKNKETALALRWGNLIKEGDLDRIVKVVDEKYSHYLPVLDFALEMFSGEDYWRVHDKHVELTNESMGHIENYLPIYRREIDKENLDKAMGEDMLNMNNLRRAYPKRGFTKERQDIPPEFQKPIKTNLVEIIYDAIQRQEHYISYGGKIRDLQGFNRDPRFREALVKQHGKESMRWLEDYTNVLSNPNYYKLHSELNRFWVKARENAAIAYLAGNLVTMMKQVPSMFYYLQEARPAYWFGGVLWTATHPKQARDFVNKDPQMKARSIQREYEEFKQFDKVLAERVRKKIGKAGFFGIRIFDKVVTTMGYIGVYNRHLDKTGNEVYARQKALETTLRTQPAAHVKDIAALYRQSEVLNMFLQFSNQLNKIYNIATYSLPQHVMNKKYQDAVYEAVSLALGAMAIWAMVHRRLPEDRDDFQDAFTDLFLNMIPVVGKSMSAVKEGWKVTAPPIIKAFGNLAILLSDKASNKAKWNKVIESFSIIFGAPYIGTKRIFKTIKEEDLWEMIGGPPKE